MPLPDHISARHKDLLPLTDEMIAFDHRASRHSDPIVSATILERIDEYRTVLESYSARLLPLIAWEPTEKFNVRILNDTGDFYRVFNATPHAEFLYSCVQKTIEEDLPSKTAFLRNYDTFRSQVEAIVDMPDRTIDLLFRFLQQNGGTLSRRARTNEFKALTDDETARIEVSLHALVTDCDRELPELFKAGRSPRWDHCCGWQTQGRQKQPD